MDGLERIRRAAKKRAGRAQRKDASRYAVGYDPHRERRTKAHLESVRDALRHLRGNGFPEDDEQVANLAVAHIELEAELSIEADRKAGLHQRDPDQNEPTGPTGRS